MLGVGCWLLVVGCWVLVVGCWLLFVVCCLLLVAYVARAIKEEEFWPHFGVRAARAPETLQRNCLRKKLAKLHLNLDFGDSHFNKTLLFTLFFACCSPKS